MSAKREISKRGEASTRGAGEWLVAAYEPITLFSLRMTYATSKGGKTLVTPTPYAIKMALLDACFRRFSPSEAGARARTVFDWVKGRDVRLRPPLHCVVNNTFMKVLDWSREPVDGPFRNTIAYREFAFFGGDELLIALGIAGLSDEARSIFEQLFAHVNNLGKRGGFWQFIRCERISGTLPFGFTVPSADATFDQIAAYRLTQALDDFGQGLCDASDGFERVSTYGSGAIRLGEQRGLTLTSIPYERRSASSHFTWYVRVMKHTT